MCLYFDGEYAFCWISVCLSFGFLKSSSANVMIISEIPGISCTLLRTLKLKNIFPKKLEHYKLFTKIRQESSHTNMYKCTPEKPKCICYEKLISAQIILFATCIDLRTNAGAALILMANTHGSQHDFNKQTVVLQTKYPHQSLHKP